MDYTADDTWHIKALEGERTINEKEMQKKQCPEPIHDKTISVMKL